MIPPNEVDSEFLIIKQRYHSFIRKIIKSLKLEHRDVAYGEMADSMQKIEPEKVYFVLEGSVGQICYGKRIFHWEPGDLILPDYATADGSPNMTMDYFCDESAELRCYELDDFMSEILSDSDKTRMWTQVMMAHQSLLTRVIAANTVEELNTTPGFEHFGPGEIIINQGDSANFVYSLFEGNAEVLVDDVVVGSVKEGEMIGAMALLTDSPRSATVRATSQCSVVKVPKEQFGNLIRSNPNMIHQLLREMASHISKLNRQVVSLSTTATTHI